MAQYSVVHTQIYQLFKEARFFFSFCQHLLHFFIKKNVLNPADRQANDFTLTLGIDGKMGLVLVQCDDLQNYL